MTTAHYTDEHVRLYHGDCIEVMRQLPDASVDAVVTDPPYALNFMGKKWDDFSGVAVGPCIECGNDDPAEGYRYCTDCMEALDGAALRGSSMLGYQSQNWSEKATHSRGYADNNNAAFQRWCQIWATEALRVLKPGGHLLAFGGTRTWHRLACAIEDAGFEVRDSIAWMYGSGFPKSLDVSKAIDKAAGAEREVGRVLPQDAPKGHSFAGETYADDGLDRVVIRESFPATPLARQWQGWGTALKPAFEPIVVARKPLAGTVAANVERYGTGALNIDGGRISGEPWAAHSATGLGSVKFFTEGDNPVIEKSPHDAGRWPANVILDESQARDLDRQSGTLTSGANPTRRGSDKFRDAYGDFTGQVECVPARGADTGGASRFFYTAKADSSERPRVDGVAHPTVKPLDLMRYLVRLVTPPGGVVLEPFAGSGTTLEACIVEGFRCIGIEREADYLPLIVQRITKPIEPVMF
jgi:DNA modification methylase